MSKKAIRLFNSRTSQWLFEGYMVEHMEVDDRSVHSIYKPLVESGVASAMANNVAAGDIGVISSPGDRKSMLKLAERMVMSFCTGVGASTAHTWTTLSGCGADDVRVMTRKSTDDPGRPPGIVLSAATSFWLPVPPKRGQSMTPRGAYKYQKQLPL